MAIVTRPALMTDAEEGVELLRRSITELCAGDHQGDAETLELWLANKDVPRFRQWVERSDACLRVAELDGVLCGVGLLVRTGEISLCYVLPGYQSRGVGRALMEALESQAASWGLERLFLDSTSGAQRFYERAGYRSAGEPTCGFGLTRCSPYEKHLRGDA